MTDLGQIFQRSKENRPNIHLTAGVYQKPKTGSTYAVDNSKRSQLNFEKLLTKDIKRNISRYSMEQQLACYYGVRKMEIATKATTIAVLITIGIFCGLPIPQLALEMFFLGGLMILHYKNYLIGPSNEQIKQDLNMSRWLRMTLFFVTYVLLAVMYHTLSLIIILKLVPQTWPVSDYLVWSFAGFNTLCIFLINVYYPAIVAKDQRLWSNRNSDFTFITIVRWPLVCLKMFYELRRFRVLFAMQLVIYVYHAIGVILEGKDSYYYVGLNIYFVASQVLSLAITLAFLHFVHWFSCLMIYRYQIRVNGVHVYVSLLKLESNQANNHIQQMCLTLLTNKLRRNRYFMETQINTSKFYKNYWDIFQQFAIRHLHQVSLDILSISEQLNYNRMILNSKKTPLDDMFIFFRRARALIGTEVLLITLLNKLQTTRKIYQILVYGRRHSSTHNSVALNTQITNCLHEINQKCNKFVDEHQKVITDVVIQALLQHADQAQVLLKSNQDSTIPSRMRKDI